MVNRADRSRRPPSSSCFVFSKAVTVLGSPGHYRWRAARPERPLVRWAILRRRTRQLLSMRKKFSTLVCRLSMSSTTKALEHIVPAYNLPRGRAGEAVQVAAAAEVAAEAPQAVQAAQALEGRTVSRERLPALKREARRRPEPSA